MENLNKIDQIQEDEYVFPYHYLDIGTKTYKLLSIGYLAPVRYVTKIVASLGKNLKILDAGCGDGRLCYELKNISKNVHGIDYSKKAIGFAKSFNPDVKFYAQDLSTLKVKEKFDVVTSVEVLEHIPPKDLPKVVKDISKVVKKGGHFVLTVPSKNVKLAKKHYQHFSVDSISKYISKDFDIQKIIGIEKVGIEKKIFRILRSLLLFTSINTKLFNFCVKRLDNFYTKRVMVTKASKGCRLLVIAKRR